ncbi:MAG TPA: right-handed parallel beta-helix repeat-containing protein [Patescibacteria group bacterium]|nr:right-handed parallel beta-helix repeat-containing protein [Patescibacteria group bacterium]
MTFANCLKKIIKDFRLSKKAIFLAVFLILPINFLLLPKDYVLAQPQAQISVFKTSGLAPFTVLFNAKNSSGNIVRYEWNFNDSNSDYPPTDEGRMVGHRFDNPGSYNVQLTIYEENGSSAQAQITITALSAPADAQTYYVSMSGSSANDGLSPATPWNLNKILVKNTAFIPNGSKILFKRGDDFTIATSSFEINYLLRPAPNYLTLDAYDTGEKPIFGPVTTYARDRYYNKGIIIQNLQVKTLKIQGQYSSSSFVYPGLQVALRNLKVTNGDVHIWQSEGITLENIYINRGCDTATNPADPAQCPTGMGLAVSSDPPGSGYFYINNLEVNGARSHCVYFAGNYHEVLVENSNFHHCGVYLQTSLRDGFTIHGQVDNLILRSNQIHHNNFALGLDGAYDNGTPPEYLRNVIVEDNKIYSNQSPWPNTDHGIQIRSMQNSIFRNNLIYDNAGMLFWIAGPKVDDGQLDEPTNNIEIYHNTIYTTRGSIILYLGHNVTPNHNDMVSNIYFKNNIVAGSSGKVLTSVLPDLSTVFMDNNIYGGVFVKPAIDPNSFNLDPLLVNPAGSDFALQDSSPAINAGAILKVKYDYAGNLRDSSPDIGAYENLSTPPPPADTTAPTTTANPGTGSYPVAQSVALTTDEIATIYYCLGSGCNPNIVYSSPLLISQSNTLRFYAVDLVGNQETIKEANYLISIGGDTQSLRVVTYLKAGGLWFIKPSYTSPLTAINTDGTWQTWVRTGGIDEFATEIVSYLVPADTQVPLCGLSPAFCTTRPEIAEVQAISYIKRGADLPLTIINFMQIPSYGDADGNLHGHLAAANPNDFRVVTYVRVDSLWLVKPDVINPLSLINVDGIWQTGGIDEFATEIVSYLVPAATQPPLCDSQSTLCSSQPNILEALSFVYVKRSIDTPVNSINFTQVPAYGDLTGDLQGEASNILDQPSTLIDFTQIPPYGDLTGDLRGQTNVSNPSDFRVATYLKAGGLWFIKPSYTNPLTPIGSDGSWQTWIRTGGIDEFATEIVSYLVPADTQVPLCGLSPAFCTTRPEIPETASFAYAQRQ